MILYSIVFTLFACGDKSGDTSTEDTSTEDTSTEDTATEDTATEDTATEDTSNDTATTDSITFQGMNFVFHSAQGFSLIGNNMNLSFPEDRFEMSFNAGCNSFFGDYTVSEEVFELSGMSGTEMACDTSLMDQDNWLVTFFTSSPTINHDGDLLTFTGADATLIFQDSEVANPDMQLTDVPWEIDTYIDGEFATSYNINTIPNFYFASDGTFTLNSGCNGSSGTYSDSNGTLAITIDTMTDAICGGDLDTVEGHIFQVFNGSPSYEIDGDRITLTAGDKGVSAYASFE